MVKSLSIDTNKKPPETSGGFFVSICMEEKMRFELTQRLPVLAHFECAPL
jgi:hypothetical protein